MMKRFFFSIFVLMLAACAKMLPLPEADVLYRQGFQALHEGRFSSAAEAFDTIEANYPYSDLVEPSILMGAYASYQRNDYAETTRKLDAYINTYPASPKLDYAFYLYGLSYYEQISDISRDQGTTKDARDAFAQLINRFPESVYAQDARVKLTLINDSLAGKEIAIGRFYQEKNACPAALSRFRLLIDSYDTTAHVAEALYRSVECYLSLSLPEEAQRMAAILQHNYPGSYWYRQSWELLEDYQ